MFKSKLTFIPACVVLATTTFAAGADRSTLDASYRETAGAILGAALTDTGGWEKLTYLTTRIGHRLSGSPQLEEAIRWAQGRMQAEGLENVRQQPVKVPHWVRGRESAEVVAPVQKKLNILGLGMSVGTPPEGLTAPVVVVGSFEELHSLGRDKVEGKIVLYAVPWQGYGRTVQYRSRGPSEAAKLGALAVLVRSATGHSLYTPHTGALRYQEQAPRIPAAAVTVEDAEWMARMARMGLQVKVKLFMEARMLPEADSSNLIAEIAGREKAEEVVVMGGHFDSWDVGQGAHDDGAACIANWQALKILKDLKLRPRRTLRVVLWTNEENGLAGGRAYRRALGDDVHNHVAAIEMDGGVERPVGFGLGIGAPTFGRRRGQEESEPSPEARQALAKLKEIGRLLEGLEAGEMTLGGGGADISPLMRAGVPGLALRTVGEHYFDWHHTRADTLDKVDPQNFRKAVAMLAVMGYILADMPDRLIGARASSHPETVQ
ncbi:MAG: M20/M25/M40 family metallo-hydrolase [Acidobacteriota bacterium]